MEKIKAAIKIGKEIRKDIRKARHTQRMNELKEKLWYDLKKMKKGFQPDNTKIRDKRGRVVPSTKKTETIATYLEETQWGDNKKTGEISTELLFEETAKIRTGKFTLDELRNASNTCVVLPKHRQTCRRSQCFRFFIRVRLLARHEPSAQIKV